MTNITTTLNENILTVVTPITKEMAETAFSEFMAKDKDGNDLYYVATNKEGEGGIYESGMVCNTVVQGNLAVKLIMPMGTTLDDVKKMYGKKLVIAEKYMPEIVEAATAEITAINGIFAE